MIAMIIVTAVFIGVVILILTDKMNRAVAALAGALICYFTLVFVEKYDFIIFLEYLFGTAEDNYVNLKSMTLILGMMFIVQVCHEAGVFQFLAFRMVQLTKGNSKSLLATLCTLTVLISAVLNNILTVIVLIPLTITISRIINVNPAPYILCQAILVNIGGTVFLISSIPNILITNYVGITFNEFFLNVGIVSIAVYGVTLLFFFLLFGNKLTIPKDKFDIFLEFDTWNLVQDRGLFYKAVGTLLAVMTGFILIPSTVLSPDIIALTGGVILIIISKLNPRQILEKIDFELLLYLLGIFVISGALESVGTINIIGELISALGGGNVLTTVLSILWISAFFSAAIDNIPITKVLIPVVDFIGADFSPAQTRQMYYSLVFGANWGDNLTPMGDNILVMNLAERHNRPIPSRDFFILGFITTVIQLVIMTIYFAVIIDIAVGIIILVVVACVLAGIVGLKIAYQRSEKFRSVLGTLKQKLNKSTKKQE